MRRDALLGLLAERGLLVSPDALEYMEKAVEGEDEVRNIMADIENPGILGLDRVRALFEKKMREEREMPSEPDEQAILSKRSVPEPQIVGDFHPEVLVLKDVTGNSRSTANVDNFAAVFQDRYRKIRGMFRGDTRVKGTVDIARLPRANGDVTIIGMVTDFHDTAKGVVATLEDPTGLARVFFRKEALQEKLIMDEVIAVHGRAVPPKGKNGISMFADRVYWPDIPIHEPNLSEEPVSAAFISDVHIGSNTFLRDSWDKFISWLNSDDPVGRRIGYLVMAGDVVDGVGIYPGQEEELEISDIYGQYEALARDIERIPERIKVILSPGNHDFSRPAEPQPAFGEEIRSFFTSSNVEFVGSPSLLELSGVKVLVYHGTSINDFISNLPGVSYEDPSKALRRMLKSRILAASYGGSTPLAPEQMDYMVIDEVPDIFVTGHVHSYVRFKYRGTTVINASTWQSQTEYQKMNNFKPIPGVVTIVELDTARVIEKRFYSS